MHSRPSRWAPSHRSTNFISSCGTLYRWRNGRVQPVYLGDPALQFHPSLFRSATVFTQRPDTHHVLAVEYDVRTRSVSEAEGGWQELGFSHSAPSNGYAYSYLQIAGDEPHVAASGNSAWMQEVLTSQYRFDQTNPPLSQSTRTGLIGRLPLILALVAFSCPAGDLDRVLQRSLRPGQWLPHRLPHGRKLLRPITT